MSDVKASGGQQTTIAVVAAIYTLLLGLFNVCGNLALIGLGSLGSSLSNELANAGADAAELGELAGASSLATIVGILGLALGIAAIVVSVGLFMRSPWAYMGTLAVNGAFVVVGLLSILSGGFSIVTLLFIVLSGAIVYFFMTNKDTKAAFGR